MLKKSNRLSNVKGFQESGKISTGSLVIKFSENKKNSRFAFIISKKIDKRATIRNKIKRTLSNYFKNNLGNLQPRDYLLIVKKNILYKRKEIEEELSQVLEKIK